MGPGQGRIAELDGLRGAAIALVIAFHIVLSVPSRFALVDRFLLFGWSGVDLFFVLSGFLIGGILLDHRESASYFATFYARRFFRIIPVYFGLLALYGLFWSLGGELRSELIHHTGQPMSWLAYVTFTNNFWIALHDSMKIFLPPSWSLAIEEQFYLTLPLAIYLVRPRHISKVIAGAIAAIVAARWICCATGAVTQNQAYVLPWFRTDGLLLGVTVAMLIRNQRASAWVRRNLWSVWALAAVMGVVLFRCGTTLPADNATPSAPIMTYGLTCVSAIYACVLVLALFGGSRWLSRALRLRPLRWLGKVSYCLYLLHVPIFAAAFIAFGARPMVALGALLVMLAVAELSWRFYEAPLLRIAHRFQYAQAPEPQLASLAEAPSIST